MFKVGDVVRHRASGERFVVLERGSDGLRCDDGVTCHRWLDEVCLEAAPPLADSWVSRTELVARDRDDKAWNLSTKKDGTYDG